MRHVRRAFKAITKRAGLGENWTPRELRHSFVPLMSDNGVSIGTIADFVGHASTAATEEGLPAPAHAGDHRAPRP